MYIYFCKYLKKKKKKKKNLNIFYINIFYQYIFFLNTCGKFKNFVVDASFLYVSEQFF